MNLDIAHLMRPGTLNLSSLPPLSVYVHLPWCLKKCPYCDFNSHEWRAPAANAAVIPLHKAEGGLPEDAYLDALCADLESSLPLVWAGRYTVFSLAAVRRVCFLPMALHD